MKQSYVPLPLLYPSHIVHINMQRAYGTAAITVVSNVVSFVWLELINHSKYEISACPERNLKICCIANPV